MTSISEVVERVATWNPARATSDDPFPYIDLSAVDQLTKRITQARSTLPSEAPSRARQLIRRGDVLVSTVRPNLNAVAHVDTEFDGATASTGFTVLRASNEIDSRYLFHWVQTPSFVDDMVRQATGASYPAVSDAIVKASTLPLPPIEEQRRVAAILDHVADLALTNSVARRLASDLQRAAYRSTSGLDEAREASLADLCRSSDDMKCGPFGTQLKSSEFRTEGVPLWGIKQVNRCFQIPTHEFLDESTARRLRAYDIVPGDIVMTRKGTVGNCSVYPETRQPGIMHSDLLRIRVDLDLVLPEFLSHQLHHSPAVAGQIARQSAGAVMPGLNVTRLRSLQVKVPSLISQRQFVDRVREVRSIEAKLLARDEELSSLLASLQARAFSGRL